MQAHMVSQFAKFVSMIPYLPDELQVVVMNIKDPGKVTDLIASNLNISLEEKQELLVTLEVRQPPRAAVHHPQPRDRAAGARPQDPVAGPDRAQQEPEGVLPPPADEGDPEGARRGRSRAPSEIEELREKIDEAKIPPEAREGGRPRARAPAHDPAGVGRAHASCAPTSSGSVDLPWAVVDRGQPRPPPRAPGARRGPLRPREDQGPHPRVPRGAEAASRTRKSPILCFVGPPGVGKTSLGRSIARAMGRKFVRLSLGGVRDEAEIRGHRRTYIGALPGRIIQNLRTAGANNPLFMLDEIDKLGIDFRGDPASALLEVLDPEQNHTFQDHYLDVPFDLSQVMFVTTANVLDPIPPPLRDRMEVIELAGYTEEEKLEIAKRHLIPKQLGENGLTARESPLRGRRHRADRRATTRARRACGTSSARSAASAGRSRAPSPRGGPSRSRCTPRRSASSSAPERFFSEVAERTEEPGVAVGPRLDADGGDILFIEATRMAGKKGLTLTGQLGDVMKESAQAALSYVRSRAERLGIAPRLLRDSRPPHPRAGGRDPEGRPVGRRHHGDRARLAADGPPGAPERRDDGRDHAARQACCRSAASRRRCSPPSAPASTRSSSRSATRRTWRTCPEPRARAMRFIFVDTMDEVLDLALHAGPRPRRSPRTADAASACPSCGRIPSPVAG